MKLRTRLVLGIVLLCASFGLIQLTAQPALPVVPGGAGYGMQTRAAYACGMDPTVVEVTNLDDSGGGSFRAALDVTTPKIIVFRVSGTILSSSYLGVEDHCTTIAGQTAPSPGITLAWDTGFGDVVGFFVDAHDVLIQHIRIRPGGSCNQAMGIFDYGGGGSGVPYNVVLDHVSLSWAQDETAVATSGAHDITIWRSIIAEGLFNVPGAGGCDGGQPSHGHGFAIGDNVQNISVIQSLFAHNLERNPAIGAGSTSYISNNVIYNGHEGMLMQGPGDFLTSIIGNYFKRGPTSRSDIAIFSQSATAGAEAYLSDNTVDNGGISPAMLSWSLGSGVDPRVGSEPISKPTGYTPLSAAVTYNSVLNTAGARPVDRDLVDARLIEDVQNRTNDIISHPDAVGGYPTLAENSQPFTPVANPHGDSNADGYTNLENQLHALATDVEEVDPLPDIADAAGSSFVSALFNGAAGLDILASYIGEVGADFAEITGSFGFFVITNDNKARTNYSNDFGGLYASGVPGTAEYDVTIKVTVNSVLDGNFYSLIARQSTSAFTGIYATWASGLGTCTLTNYVAGAATNLDVTACSMTAGNTYLWRLLVRSGGVVGWEIDGTPILWSDAATVTDAGRAAFSVYATTADSNTIGVKLDELTAIDLAGDVTNPVVTITIPTSSATYSTDSSPITIGGTCTDNLAPSVVTYVNAAGGSGTATGTSNWSANVSLTLGANAITVTCKDAALNQHTDLITVTYSTVPPTPGLSIPGVVPRKLKPAALLEYLKNGIMEWLFVTGKGAN